MKQAAVMSGNERHTTYGLLDRDIMTVSPDQIRGTVVLATYLGGRPVYEKR